MSDDLAIFPEELLKRTAPTPELSPGLRTRVLAVAAEASERRTQARRVASSALALLALLGYGAWCTPKIAFDSRAALAARAVQNSGAEAMAGAPATAAPAATLSPLCRAQMLLSAMGDDWRLVEAELRLREKFSRRMPM